jgi:hypothetical protein
MAPKKILLITSSGGNGLLQAAVAKEQQLKLENPNVVIFKVDVVKQWLGRLTGRFGIFFWNYCMKAGHVKSLTFFWSLNKIAGMMYYHKIFYNLLKLLRNEHMDRVIDTQILATGCLLKVIRLYNWLHKKDLFLEKVIVDLPTKDCHDFFNTIKCLSKKDKKRLKILSVPPLLEDCQTNEEFWQKYCRISENSVRYEPFYIRQGFYKYQNMPKENNKPIDIAITTKCAKEKETIINAIKHGHVRYVSTKDGISFTIESTNNVITILLGSQPSQKATYKYVKTIMQMTKNSTSPFVLFVFCAHFIDKHDSLFYKIANLINAMSTPHKSLTIIPMSYQQEDVIASLFHRSNLTITRSAGQTTLELIMVGRGQHFIHSEAYVSNKDTITQHELLKGMPIWEAGSARYLQKEKNSILVTPLTLESYFEKFMSSCT